MSRFLQTAMLGRWNALFYAAPVDVPINVPITERVRCRSYRKLEKGKKVATPVSPHAVDL